MIYGVSDTDTPHFFPFLYNNTGMPEYRNTSGGRLRLLTVLRYTKSNDKHNQNHYTDPYGDGDYAYTVMNAGMTDMTVVS